MYASVRVCNSHIVFLHSPSGQYHASNQQWIILLSRYLTWSYFRCKLASSPGSSRSGYETITNCNLEPLFFQYQEPPVQPVTWGWWVEQQEWKVEWRCAPMECGALYVMTYGISEMQWLSVDNWVYPREVSRCAHATSYKLYCIHRSE